MATRKPQKEDAPARQVPPGLEFLAIATADALLMGFKPAAPRAPTPEQARALSKLAEPGSALAIALLEELKPRELLDAVQKKISGESNYYRSSMDATSWAWGGESSDGALAILLSSWSADDWDSFGAACSQLASEAREALSSETFLACARAGSRSIVHARSPERLSYPLAGLHLGESTTQLAGKRSRALVAYLHPDTTETEISGENPLPSARLFSRAARSSAEAMPARTVLAAPTNPYASSQAAKSQRVADLARIHGELAFSGWGTALRAAMGGATKAPDDSAPLGMGRPNLAKLHGKGWAFASNRRRSWMLDADTPAGRARFDDNTWASTCAAALKLAPAERRPEALSEISELLGADFAALGSRFAKRSGRLGVAQAAALLWPAMEAARLLPSVAEESTPPARDGAHLRAAPGMSDLMGALREARDAYGVEALREAELQERLWMRQAGWEQAWDQALAVGEPSAKSLAWSRANPMDGALASSDPMERLAGASSRALGLSSKLDPAQVAADYKEALRARGATEQGLDLLARGASLREIFEDLARGISGAHKETAHASSAALHFAAHGLSRCAELGMDPEASADFLRAYAQISRKVDASEKALGVEQQRSRSWGPASQWAINPNHLPLLPRYLAGRKAADGFDGLGPDLGLVGLFDYDSALALRELGAAKARGYPLFVEALARDWRDTLAESARLGATNEAARDLAGRRSAEIRLALPAGAVFDWRADWADQPAWKLCGVPSPRFSAALFDARARCGSVGAWVADRARKLGISDARDGNDLVAQARDIAKSRAGMTDAAWKIATKTEQGLALLEDALDLARGDPLPQFGGPRLPAHISAGFDGKVPANAERGDLKSARDKARELGIALSAAAVAGVAPQDAAEVASALFDADKGSNLFGLNIQPQACQGGAGAAFFCQETEAKRSRQSKIFAEACKRFQKIKADAATPATEGAAGADPRRLFAEEVGDLCDWASACEAGLWTDLPPEPTWGQLRRLSKAWHDEAALVAFEKASKAKLANELAEAAFDAAAGLNPFAAKASSRWARLLGSHASEGWEAVELLSSSDLTEEGAAMRHCVSSYSSTCREGQSRIFSVRLNGERVSTLQVAGDKSLSAADPATSFQIQQNKGIYNNQVPRQCADFCAQVLSKIQDSWPAQCASIQKKIAARKQELSELATERRAAKPR